MGFFWGVRELEDEVVLVARGIILIQESLGIDEESKA
jgi:hypothetical protein